MQTQKQIRPERCSIYLASPVSYEQCVAMIESADHPFALVVAEQPGSTHKCIDWNESTIGGCWIALDDLNALLALASRVLEGEEQGRMIL